jgi:hypothetical protein
MNWKNVLYLLRVERKSGRLIRGVKTTRYRENGILAYWPYWVAAIIGIAGGLLANVAVQGFYSSISGNPSQINMPPLSTASVNFFVTMPTLILILSVVFTMLQQIQLAGLKATSQPMYWLPMTWQEHTLASILANLFGFPLATVIGFASGLIVFAAFNALIWQAVLTTLALFAAAFMGSATTEIIRVLQVRFTGAVYKSSGRAAVWVRFIGSLVFFLVFYIIYFSITQGFTNFIQGLANIQNIAWFIPYIWPGLSLFYLLNTVIAQGILFIALTVAFMAVLYYIAVNFNVRFGLYEPPAITIQKSGATYAPKTGFLGKIGFSSIEAALIRKDIRAFTRRRELISIFIVPIVFIIIPLLNSVNLGSSGTAPAEIDYIFVAMTFLFPAGIMAMTMGNMLIGEEGQAVWRIYASPISPKNLVRSKLFFLLSFSTVILLITGIVGVLFYHPTLKVAVTLFLEAFFALLPVGAIALAIGFKGADFSAARRARMIRQEWALISLIVCAVTGLAVVAPIIPFAIGKIAGGFLGIGLAADPVSLTIALVISGVISAVTTAVFYKINVSSAATLLRKAEV